MVEIIVLIITGILSLYFAMIKKAYLLLDKTDLDYDVETDKETLSQLSFIYKHKKNTDIFIWFLLLISSAFFIYYLVAISPLFISVIILIMYLAIIFVYIPRVKAGYSSGLLAFNSTPIIYEAVRSLNPPLSQMRKFFDKYAPKSTNRITKDELIEIINTQDTFKEKDILINLLKNHDVKIKELTISLEDTKVVKENEPIGPILMDELHKTGQQYFPVREQKKKNIIGSLRLKDIVGATEGGIAKDYMKNELFYLNSNNTSVDMLNAVIKTDASFFMVINKDQKIVGSVSFNEVIKKLMGEQIENEFDSYDNPEIISGKIEEKDV